MRNPFRILVFLAAAAAAWPVAASASDHQFISVTVRVYESPLLALPDELSARAVATEILGAAGLDVRWQICPYTAHLSDSCGAPLGPRELAIRFVAQPSSPDGERTTQLGYSLVDTRTRSGSLATIYIDRVARLAEQSGARADALAGRAIAHEIGHLVVGTTSHARTGLMRPIWSREELRRDRASDWHFTPGDARAMQEALLF